MAIIISVNPNLQEGSIGHDFVIKPLPMGLINKDNIENRAHHIVYKRKVDVAEQFSDFGKYDLRNSET